MRLGLCRGQAWDYTTTFSVSGQKAMCRGTPGLKREALASRVGLVSVFSELEVAVAHCAVSLASWPHSQP